MSFKADTRIYQVPTRKTCNTCKKRQSIGNFHKQNAAPDGHQYFCKDCHRKRKKKYNKGRPLLKIDGQRFGRLLVIKLDFMFKNRSRWLCQCDCGKRTTVNGSDLRFGSTKSCGCLSREVSGNRYKLPCGQAMFNKIAKSYRKSASSRGLKFSLTIPQLISIFASDCFYCGKSPSNRQGVKNGNGAFTYSGIDRYDNEKGYIFSNVVPCCRHCNLAKRDLSASDFIEWASRVVAHMGKKEAKVA